MDSRRSLAAIPVIAGLVLAVYLASLAVLGLLGVPRDLGTPWPIRVLGVPLIAYGIGMMVWVFRFRGPREVLTSTWVTLVKLLGRTPLEEHAGRTEPLVVAGPYRYVRHPLYSGVDGLALGIALVVDHPWAYAGALLLVLWFAVVLAPFEERELRALFGTAYEEYMRTTRRFLPLRRRA